MRHPKDVGDQSTLAIMIALQADGYAMFVPFGENTRYAHHPHPTVTKRTYEGEIDEFAVYCPDTCGVYLLPIEDVRTRNTAALRVEPTKNCQRKRVRLAAAYEIARVEIV
jgi:PD-(D/E)XK endonuclease